MGWTATPGVRITEKAGRPRSREQQREIDLGTRITARDRAELRKYFRRRALIRRIPAIALACLGYATFVLGPGTVIYFVMR